MDTSATPPPLPNPYSPPQAPVGSPAGDPTLASPWLRLAAAIIDGVILFPINYVLGMILLKQPSISEAMEAAKKGPEAVEALMPGKGMMLVGQIVGLAVFIGVNYVFLKKGQTIGKMLLKLQIRNRNDGSLLPIQDLIVKRVLPIYGVAALANSLHQLIGLLLIVDCVMIFRAGRNTLHDDLANTKVVKLPG